MNIVAAMLVVATPFFQESNKEFSMKYYILLLIMSLIQSVILHSMFVSQMAFFAKISDKRIGGTYMTLLNTISNMGGSLAGTLALYIAGWISIKQCIIYSSPEPNFHTNTSLIFHNSTLSDMIVSNNTCSSQTKQQVKYF